MSFHARIWKSAGVLVTAACEAVGGIVAQRLRQFARQARHRRDVRFLTTLDDRALADIGLNRCDVSFAASGPFWRDPGPLLASRAAPRGRDHRSVTAGRRGAVLDAPSIVPKLSRSTASEHSARAAC